MEIKVVCCIGNHHHKECLMPIKCFFMGNPSSNFYLFLDITKPVFNASINAYLPEEPVSDDVELES
jgi:hypothetical protein